MTPQYTVVEIGTLPGGWISGAASLNNATQIVGWSYVGGRKVFDGFPWDNGDLSAFGTAPEFNGSQAIKINDKGQIIGHTYPPPRELYLGKPMVPFLYENGRFNYLPMAEQESIRLCDFNNRSQIIGVRETGEVPVRERKVRTKQVSFLWSEGKEIQIEDFTPVALNEKDQIVGNAYIPSEWLHACLWQDQTITSLGSLGHGSRAADINDKGQVVGVSETWDEEEKAFLWENGTMHDLGTLSGRTESEAHAINNLGQVVGDSSIREDAGNFEHHGFLWQNGTLFDLNDLIDPALGWEITVATDINDHGQIIGGGQRKGHGRSLLLMPL